MQVICFLVVVCSCSATFIETTVSLPRNAQRLQVLKAVVLPCSVDCLGGNVFKSYDDGTATTVLSHTLFAFSPLLLYV